MKQRCLAGKPTHLHERMKTRESPKNQGVSRRNWQHPGGKLRELGADKLTDAELLAILISSGIKGKTAEDIANEILRRFNSFRGMANQPFREFLKIKGLGMVKMTRIAAAFEIARRIVNEVLADQDKEF
ncbi:MAG: UPF0758 domain-containing protein [candidate division WOR-3 bacterium]